MVMSRDPGFKFRKSLFLPNSILNFRKSYLILGKLAQEQKVTGKKQIGGGGWKTPSSAYRVKFCTPILFKIGHEFVTFWIPIIGQPREDSPQKMTNRWFSPCSFSQGACTKIRQK